MKKQSTCLNCNHQFQQPYPDFCGQCGQKNLERRMSFRTLIYDFFGDTLSFDNRIFRSIFFLVFRPGHLTKVFNQGKRIAFVPPVRIFLISGLVFVLILSSRFRSIEPGALELKNGQLASWEQEAQAKLDSSIAAINADSPGIDSAAIDDLHINLDGLLEPQDSTIGNLIGEKTFFRENLLNQISKFKEASGISNYLQFAIANLSFASFLLMPFFALLLKLLYSNKTFYYVEHFIFALHFHAFLYILASAFFLIRQGWSIAPIILVIYSILALKNAYQQSVLRTLVKFAALLVIYPILIFLYFLLYFAVSFYLF